MTPEENLREIRKAIRELAEAERERLLAWMLMVTPMEPIDYERIKSTVKRWLLE